MSVLARIMAGSDPTPIEDLQNPSLWMIRAFGGLGTVDAGNPNLHPITPELALSISATFAALRCLSEDTAKLPLRVYRRVSPRTRERVIDHPVADLLHSEINQEQIVNVVRETWMVHALGWGNGFLEREPRRDERPGEPRTAALHQIHPSRVRMRRDRETRARLYDILGDDGNTVTLPAERVLQLHGLGHGLVGWPILSLARGDLNNALAIQTFLDRFYRRGATLGGVLETPKLLTDREFEKLRQDWESQHGGVEQSWNPLVLQRGLIWKPTAIHPADAQTIQTRIFGVEEIARWFRVPSHKLGDLRKMTYNNLGQVNRSYVTDSLMPWMRRIEQTLERLLFSRAERRVYFVEHLISAVLRGNDEERSRFYREMFSVGAFSPNDIRAMENLPDIGPAGDRYFVPRNFGPLDEYGAAKSASRPGANVRVEGRLRPICRPGLESSLRRVFAKGASALARAIERHHGDADGFASWAEGFFGDKHAAEFRDAIAPTVETAAAVLGRSVDDLGRVSVELSANRVVEESLREALGAFQTDDGPETITRWRNGRSAQVADDVLGTLTAALESEVN